MKRTSLILLVTVLMSLPLHAQLEDFRTYVDPHKNFLIDFPGDPTVSGPLQKPQQVGIQTLLTVQGDLTYRLKIIDLPNNMENYQLRNVARDLARRCHGIAEIGDQTPSDGHPSAFISLGCPAKRNHPKTFTYIHVVVSGNRIYEAFVEVTPTEDQASPNNPKRGVYFVNSLHVR